LWIRSRSAGKIKSNARKDRGIRWDAPVRAFLLFGREICGLPNAPHNFMIVWKEGAPMPVNSFADYPVSWRPEIPAGAGHGGDGRGHERRAAVYSVADIRID